MVIDNEINFVVKNSSTALEVYKNIFDIDVIKSTDFPQGMNEATFKLNSTRFHMLDENTEYNLLAPNKENPNTIWFNITVTDIKKTYATALENGCEKIQGITAMMNGSLQNAIFIDSFGYIWMLQQINKNLSFEERINILDDI